MGWGMDMWNMALGGANFEEKGFEARWRTKGAEEEVRGMERRGRAGVESRMRLLKLKR
jgi:hypothetical protein